MTQEPTEADVLELIKRKAEANASKPNWIVDTCLVEIANMEATIVKLRRLIDLCKNPEVVTGIELFVGKK
jgi:hypothetical protein